MVDLAKQEGFEEWLRTQPRDICIVIAVRAALRAFPVLAEEFGRRRKNQTVSRDIVLPVVRALASSLAVAKYPSKNNELSSYVAAAAYAAKIAGRKAYIASRAADAVDTNDADDTASIAADTVSHAAQDVGSNIPIYDFAAADARLINDGGSVLILAKQPLKIDRTFEWASGLWPRLETSLHNLENGWDVWTRWYDAVLEGKPAPGGEELDIFRVKLNSEGDWSKGPAHVNALIKAKEEEITARNSMQANSQNFDDFVAEELPEPDFSQASVPEDAPESRISKAKTTGEELAKYSSPQPILTADGKLDVRPNAEFDVLVASQDLRALPIRQQRLINVILDDLPHQAPRHLKSSLEHYGEELKVRGVNPFLGILKDMAEIIVVASAENDGEWLQPGLRKSFELFSANHIVFIEHFPLDIEREKRFGEIAVNEDSAIGEAFVNPFREVESAVKASIFVTANTVVVMERMRELAEITAYMPPLHGGYLDPRNVVPQPSDHFAVPSVRKRLILQIVGLLSACKSMLSPVAKLVDLFYKFSKLIELFHRYFPHPL